MPYNFGFVDQGVNKMTKVKEYINAGMDTIIQVTQDMLDYDAGISHLRFVNQLGMLT